MKTADGKQNIHICMISDDNYVVPTCVTIQSLIHSKNVSEHYYIHIVASALADTTIQQFRALESSDVTINIIKEDAPQRFQALHIFEEGSICAASIAALLKFILPELLPELDRVLYLDGDIIVRKNLGELYNYNIKDYYAAAVIDSGSIYYKHEYVEKVANYFNSGVMLLNLKRLRDEKLAEKLIQTKKEMKNYSLMDQNVFNLVFDGHVLLLPVKYNFMPVSLDRSNSKWTIKQINERYGTSYQNKKQMYEDAAIIHYSSKDKPWKNLDGACAAEWLSVYLRTPVPHDLVSIPKGTAQRYKVSVIMPCYNVENYIKETLESVLKQTLQEFELICLDDGSTDGTLEILRQYEKDYHNITVISNTNHGQGYERNQGIQYVQSQCETGAGGGDYIYFMDSDDKLHPKCLETIYNCALENKLDLLYFEGTSFYESEQLENEFPQYKYVYNRKQAYPCVYSGEDLYIKLRNAGELIVSPCLQLVRTSFLLENNLRFPELPLMEDNLYTFHSILCARRVKCLPDVLFYRRVRNNSTMTARRERERITALVILIQETLRKFAEYEPGSPMSQAIFTHLRGYFKILYDSYSQMEPEERDPMMQNLPFADWEVLIFMLYFQMEDSQLGELRDKLRKAWDEKSEINRKLQITYGEKAERGIEIKKLKEQIAKSNSELNSQTIAVNIKISSRFLKKVKGFLRKYIWRRKGNV